MKAMLTGLVLVCALADLGVAAEPPAAAATTIKEMIKQREAAWKAKNVEALVATLTDDVDSVSSRGVLTQGKDAVRKQYETVLAEQKVQLKSSSEIQSLRALGSDMYLVTSIATVQGPDAAGKVSEYRVLVTLTIVAQGNDYKIAAIRTTRVAD